jgi:hypothetical protein
MKYLLLIISICWTINAICQPRKIEKAFEVAEKDLIPEGIAYDKAKGDFYIGSINKSKIIKIDGKNKVSDFLKTGTYGNWAYLGMKVDPEQRVLWTCRNQMLKSIDSAGYGGIFKYDLQDGSLIKKYIVHKTADSHLLNDLVIQEGVVYVTDSEGGGILMIRPDVDTLEHFIPDKTFIYPNGITISPDSNNLILASARGIQKIDLLSRDILPITHPSYYIVGIDGLYTHNDYLIGIQNVVFPESINKFKLGFKGDDIADIEILSCNEPVFTKVTTGAIKDNYFYFIANSHIDQLDEDGTIKDPSKLKNLQVYKVLLD